MIYTVRHLTTYTYGNPVSFARYSLRLRPVNGDGQTLLSSEIIVTPTPRSRTERRDYFGIPTVSVTIETPHDVLMVDARSRVRVERTSARLAGAGPDWTDMRAQALGGFELAPDSPVHFAAPSRRVPLNPEVTDYARRSFWPGRGIADGARDLMGRIRRDFTFDAKATAVSTPLADAFAKRRGVCQDFAHIMIAGLRGLGLPAAYVSGYIRTIPPPGRKRLVGADASHAWVSVWCGDRWAGFDPTNDAVVGDDHIAVAHGRDYADVAPVDGLVLVSGPQRLKVAVDVMPEGEE